MSSKKKRKSPCLVLLLARRNFQRGKKVRFHSIRIELMCKWCQEEQNRWENDTVSANRAKTEGKGKDKLAQPDSQESWQKVAGRTTVAGDRPQESLLKSVCCRFCHADVTLLRNVSARSGLGSSWILSCQNEDCPSRNVPFSNHKCLGAFTVRSGNFSLDRYLHACVPEGFLSLVYASALSLSLASLKLFRQKGCESTLARA